MKQSFYTTTVDLRDGSPIKKETYKGDTVSNKKEEDHVRAELWKLPNVSAVWFEEIK